LFYLPASLTTPLTSVYCKRAFRPVNFDAKDTGLRDSISEKEVRKVDQKVTKMSNCYPIIKKGNKSETWHSGQAAIKAMSGHNNFCTALRWSKFGQLITSS
jgi:hypothetical protein